MEKISTKTLLKVCAGCVAVVWLFCIGLVVGTYFVRNGMMTLPETQTQVQPTESTTQIVINMVTNQATPTTTEQVTITLPGSDTGLTTYAGGQQSTEPGTMATEPPASKIPSSKEDVIKALTEAINATKATKNFTASRNHNMAIAVDDITGGALVKSIADSIIADKGNMTNATYTFVNGVDQGGSDETPDTLVFPPNKPASLDPAGVKSATATDNGDGTYTIQLEMNPEKQTNTSPAVYHDGIYETISVESFGLPSSVNVTSMYATYNASKISATVNPDGKLKSITYCMPVSEGGGEGKMMGVTVSIKMHGQYDGTITFTY
ncbi:MAG: hypothetical protein IKA56_02220 [Clostridia bacterium]|nr:hypothetical protein [Clostridia bacterium]